MKKIAFLTQKTKLSAVLLLGLLLLNIGSLSIATLGEVSFSCTPSKSLKRETSHHLVAHSSPVKKRNTTEQLFLEEEEEESFVTPTTFGFAPLVLSAPEARLLTPSIQRTAAHTPYPFYILYKRLKVDLS